MSIENAEPIVDGKSAREKILGIPLRPYDHLDAAHEESLRARGRAILTRGWSRDGGFLKSLEPPIIFDQVNRSFSFHLHAWEPLTFLFHCADRGEEGLYLHSAWKFASDWFEQHQSHLLNQDLPDALAFARAHTATQAWYDMAVGQRIYRLAYLIDVLARDGRCTDDEFCSLWDGLIFHHKLLCTDGFFKSHNNHGFYQALGQLAAARRFRFIPEMEKYFELSTYRLTSMIERSFFPSGAHNEHSPLYHHMVVGSLLGAVKSELLPRSMNELLLRAEAIRSWMITPKNSLVPLGDTDVAKRDRVPSTRGVCFLKDAGYAFARIFDDPENVESAAYIAQIAGFHSRTHKHADHLSMVWHDKGHEILIDPGRFGYGGPLQPQGTMLFEQGFWYSDPRRIYVEKTRAHNCVEIDGRDYPRKAVKPFGSALVDAREDGDFVITSCETRHFRTVRHWRGLVMKAAHFLLVLDWLHDKENTHDYRQWFHLAPEWEVSVSGQGMRAVNGGEELRAVSLLPGGVFQPVVRGQTEPDLLGWRSDKAESLVPSPCFSILQTDNTAAFATLLVFGDAAEPDMAFSKVNATCRKGRFGWRDARGSHRLFFDRTSGAFHVTQKRGLKLW